MEKKYDKKDSMLYFVTNELSSGMIANKTSVSDYKTIDAIRRSMVEILEEHGDEKYSVSNLNNLIKDAEISVVGKSDRGYMSVGRRMYAKGGRVDKSTKKFQEDDFVIGIAKDKYYGDKGIVFGYTDQTGNPIGKGLVVVRMLDNSGLKYIQENSLDFYNPKGLPLSEKNKNRLKELFPNEPLNLPKYQEDMERGKMAKGGTLSKSQLKQFKEWMEDGNVSKNNDGTYSTQDAQYRNKLKDLNELKKYFKKEFAVHEYAHGGSIEDENREMVLNENNQIIHHTKELPTAIKGKRVPAWVVTKVHESASDLSDATHYMDGQKMAKGGEIGKEINFEYDYASKSKLKGTGEILSKNGNYYNIMVTKGLMKGKTTDIHESMIIGKMENGGSIYAGLSEKDFANKIFGANVFSEDISQYFDVKQLSSSKDDKIDKFISDLKSDGYYVKKKAYSDFTSVLGVKKKNKMAMGGSLKGKIFYVEGTYSAIREIKKRVSEKRLEQLVMNGGIGSLLTFDSQKEANEYYAQNSIIGMGLATQVNILDRRTILNAREKRDSQLKTKMADGGGVHTMPNGEIMLDSAHYGNGGGLGEKTNEELFTEIVKYLAKEHGWKRDKAFTLVYSSKMDSEIREWLKDGKSTEEIARKLNNRYNSEYENGGEFDYDYYEVYDDSTGKSLMIYAIDQEDAESIAEELDFESFEDGDEYDPNDDEYAKGGSMSRSQKEYNKGVDEYKYFVVDLKNNKAVSGWEFKDDAKDAVSDYDGDKNFKVVGISMLKSMGIENPKERFKMMAKGGQMRESKDFVLKDKSTYQADGKWFATASKVYPKNRDKDAMSIKGEGYTKKEALDDLENNLSYYADGGSVSKRGGNLYSKEDITILGVPRSKITEWDWKSILEMAKTQDGATLILKNEKGQDVKPQVEFEWYVNEKMAKGGKVGKMYLISFEDVNGYEIKRKITEEERKLLTPVINFTIIKEYEHGGSMDSQQGIDLFEDYENIPANVQSVLDNHEDAFMDGDYKELQKALTQLKKVGYTFEFDLDGQAYDLRPIGTKGKSEMGDDEEMEAFEKGGGMSHYVVNGEIFIDYMDAVDYCDNNNLSYHDIKKTKQYKDGGSITNKNQTTMTQDKIDTFVEGAKSTNATAREISIKKLKEAGLDKNGKPIESKKEVVKTTTLVKKETPSKTPTPIKKDVSDKQEPKKDSKETEDEYCKRIIAEARARKLKAKKIAKKSANKPAVTKATQRVERTHESIEKQIEAGKLKKAQIEKIIAETEDLLRMLKKALKSL